MEPSGNLKRIVERDGELHLRTFHPDYSDKPFFIPLSTIFSLIDKQSDDVPVSDGPSPSRSDILLCQAYAATHLPDRPEYYQNVKPHIRLRVLLDENLPNQLIAPLSQAFNNLTHVYHEGYASSTDSDLFEKEILFFEMRRKKNCNKNPTKRIIFSRDSDMTDLAKEAWSRKIEGFLSEKGRMPERDELNFEDIPVAFQCKTPALGKVEASDIYIAHAQDIKKAAYSGECAAYYMTIHGIHPARGASFDALCVEAERQYAIRLLAQGKENEGAKLLLDKHKPTTLKVERRGMWEYDAKMRCQRLALVA